MFTKRELEVMSELLECPYNEPDTYKECDECEYCIRGTGFCELDFVKAKISKELERKG